MLERVRCSQQPLLSVSGGSWALSDAFLPLAPCPPLLATALFCREQGVSRRTLSEVFAGAELKVLNYILPSHPHPGTGTELTIHTGP